MRFEGGNRKARRLDWTIALLELMLLIVCGCLLRGNNSIWMDWNRMEMNNNRDMLGDQYW